MVLNMPAFQVGKPKARRKGSTFTDMDARSDTTSASRALSSAHWKGDPFKGKHITLKVVIISAAQLRPHKFKGVTNTSCTAELIGPDGEPKYNTKWHTPTIYDSVNPAWKDIHTWNETDFAPGDQIKFSVHEHEKDVSFGSGTLD